MGGGDVKAEAATLPPLTTSWRPITRSMMMNLIKMSLMGIMIMTSDHVDHKPTQSSMRTSMMLNLMI